MPVSTQQFPGGPSLEIWFQTLRNLVELIFQSPEAAQRVNSYGNKQVLTLCTVLTALQGSSPTSSSPEPHRNLPIMSRLGFLPPTLQTRRLRFRKVRWLVYACISSQSRYKIKIQDSWFPRCAMLSCTPCYVAQKKTNNEQWNGLQNLSSKSSCLPNTVVL